MKTKTITEVQVTNLLREIGVNQSLAGFDSTVQAVLLLDNYEHLSDASITRIYAAVGEKLNISGQRVERRIRHGVENMMFTIGVDRLEQRLGAVCDINKGKPANGTFLASIVRTLRLENDAGAE